MITLNDVKSAAEKVSSYVHRTPLWKSETLSKRLGTNVYLKMELFQKTGSFKPRGAFNQILARGTETYDDTFSAADFTSLSVIIFFPYIVEFCQKNSTGRHHADFSCMNNR